MCKRTKASTGKKLKSCGLCRLVHYCSVEHRQQDWATHQQTCKGMAKGVPKPIPGKKVPKPKQQLNPSQELLRRHLVKAMRCAKAGDRAGEVSAHNELGIAYCALGQFERAVEH